jgi:hypothetical protein
MSLLAKAIVKNKCWVVEDNGKKFGTILSNGTSVTLVHNGQREKFSNLKSLSDRYNIIVDKNPPKKIITESHKVYDYPCEHKANNILWDVQHRLPIFTKGSKSKSFFCAGYYIVKFNNGWVKSYCPKLITLNRYGFQGPFKTQEEMQEHLRTANGITTKSTSQEL